MKQVASSSNQNSMAKGIKMITEVWKKYKHRLPEKLYLEHILQIADFLFGFKLYQPALWQGYSFYLSHFSSVEIINIKDVDHFISSFFPEGFDSDQDIIAMKVRAMLGCALCTFEEEKKHSVLSQRGLVKLLCVLDFIRIMMQAFQQHDHFSWHIYEGSSHIYTICRYLMTMRCSAQALEYLLWASISLELSVTLMTAKYLPLIITLYCAVCHCYYDNQAEVQAEEFARRALGKINELAKLEAQGEDPASRETQRAFREASIKLGALIFKRAAFETRRRSKHAFRVKTKNTLKDIPNGPWPRTPTERLLMGLFDCSAGQFLGILEALWDSNRRPLQMRMPEDTDLHEVVLELLSAGINILSGATKTGEQRCDDNQCISPIVLTPASTLIDLAIAGENKISILCAVRFIKLLFQYKQQDAFNELTKEMLNFLPGVEGQPFRKAECELALLQSFNNLMSSQKSHPREDNIKNDRLICMSDELIGLVDTLHMSVCGSGPELKPDGDLVLDTVLFLWNELKVVMQDHHVPGFMQHTQKPANDKWVWCLSVLCEVALVLEVATVDCIMMAEMIYMLGVQLERAAECQTQEQDCAGDHDNMKQSSFSLLGTSSTELLKKVCKVVKRGLDALAKHVSLLNLQDCSAVIDSAFMQKWIHCYAQSTAMSSATSSEEGKGTNEISICRKEEMEAETDLRGCQNIQSKSTFLLAKDFHLELDIIHHRASLKLLKDNAVAESELLDRIKQNKLSKALYLAQKALLEHNSVIQNNSCKTKSLLEEALALVEKACMEERKLYMTISKTPAEKTDETMKCKSDNPPPPPILLSRTDHSFTFGPAPYGLEEQVHWYQLCGRAAEGIDRKVRLSDCSLLGTGIMVPAVSGECVLTVGGLQPNQKYVFAVAAYNGRGELLGNTIGGTTLPLLASLPVPLLSTWAHLAQVAFQTEQYDIAKKACGELWSHFTDVDSELNSKKDRIAARGLHLQALQHCSPHQCQLFLTSIFVDTEINNKMGSLYCNSFSDIGPFIWEKEARLAECERMLIAIDLAMFLNDGSAAVQAVVTCYELLAPLIFHQITDDPVVQVLKKCLVVLEENSGLLKDRWRGNTSESLMHMIASITFYLSKASRELGRHQMAAGVMDCGRRLLQEVYDAQLQINKLLNQTQSRKIVRHGTVPHHISLQLNALNRKNNQERSSEISLNADNAESLQALTGSEDPILLYDFISSSTLQDAYSSVMKLRRKPVFLELAALLIQRTMEEGHLDLVLTWGKNMFQFLSRRDNILRLSTKCLEANSISKKRGGCQAPKGNEAPQQSKNTNSHDDARKKLKQKMPTSMGVRTNRDMRMAEHLLNAMASVVQRHKKHLQLRSICSQESVWRTHLNYCMAQAYLALLYQELEQLHRGNQQHRYSKFNSLSFSLAYSGILVKRDSQRVHPPDIDDVSEKASSHSAYLMTPNTDRKKKGDDSATENGDEVEYSFENVDQQMETRRCNSSPLLELLNKAALHLQRAMVLAHRGSHWNTLQCVCQTLWDQASRITLLVQTAAQFETPSPVTAHQLHTIFTPLLVLATDLIMDMLNKVQLWSLYDHDMTEEELESSLHFSPFLDDNTQVDLRWVRTLVLHTLERLHESSKWESLAHYALLFNSYTRERYAVIIVPLLVHAQRRLLERIIYLGGPTVPQPHHVKTQRVTGKEITYRSYASCQLLCGWAPNPAQQQSKHKRAARTISTPGDAALLQDTLSCYRQAVEKMPYFLQVLQHSRSLLVQLLANTQPCLVTQFRLSRGLSCSASQVKFSPATIPTPNIQPCDLNEEDFISPNAIYSLPISSDHISTVTAAYSNSVKYLQANGQDSLRVLTLHELGNLQFYTGNTRAANSCWSKAIDCIFQISGVVERWDGISFVCGSLQETIKQAGLWGCLQAAVLTAKIAQFILTSDITQRTKYSLLSAYLFKCVLCCSVAQPQADLQYASHSISDELFPGVDLFSEPHRAHLGTTVASLHFICNWIFNTGYYITLLPVLALYLHFVGHVCRDVKRTIEGKILKVRALTELCLFAEAQMEAVQLTQGVGVFLPYGHYGANLNLQPMKTFYSNKPLLDNLEALEDLVKCDFTPVVCALCGPTLCARFNLARIQLILALSNSVHGCPVPDSERALGKIPNRLMNSELHDQDRLETDNSYVKREETNIFTLYSEKDNLSPEKIKFVLLEAASSLLCSVTQQLTCHSCCEVENLELTIETNLLKANLFLQQGQVGLSSETAGSSLVLLQTSPTILREPKPESKQDALRTVKTAVSPQQGDNPRAVEARERIGVSLWLRCCLALIRSLAANTSDTVAPSLGLNTNEDIARLLQEGLDECVRWGDDDTQALLMVEGAKLKVQRGKINDSIVTLQEAVRLLSGRTYMPPGSTLTLARATLMLSNLRGEKSAKLLQLTQKLLLKQLRVFDDNVMLADGELCFSPPGLSNIYLPHIDTLNEITLQIGSILNPGILERPAQSPHSNK